MNGLPVVRINATLSPPVSVKTILPFVPFLLAGKGIATILIEGQKKSGMMMEANVLPILSINLSSRWFFFSGPSKRLNCSIPGTLCQKSHVDASLLLQTPFFGKNREQKDLCIAWEMSTPRCQRPVQSPERRRIYYINDHPSLPLEFLEAEIVVGRSVDSVGAGAGADTGERGAAGA